MAEKPTTSSEWVAELIRTTRAAHAKNYCVRRMAGDAELQEVAKIDLVDNNFFGSAAFGHFRSIYDYIGCSHTQYNMTEAVRLPDGSLREVKFHFEQLTEAEKKAISDAFTTFFNDLRNSKDVAGAILKLRETLDASPLYDTSTALGCFLHDLGYQKIFQQQAEYFPDGFDMRRAEPGADRIARIIQALDGTRTLPRPPQIDFIPLPGENGIAYNEQGKQVTTYIELGRDRIRFPIVRLEHPDWAGGQWHFVLKNGYLVNATRELREHIATHLDEGGDINELQLTAAETDKYKNVHISDLLHGRGFQNLNEDVQSQIEKAVDAARTREQGKDAVNPLSPCCIDEDLLTGLRMDGGKNSQLNQFTAWLKEKLAPKEHHPLTKLYIESISTSDRCFTLIDMWLQDKTLDETKTAIFGKALQRLAYQIPKMRRDINELIDPNNQPDEGERYIAHLVGGTATGKTGAQNAVQSFCKGPEPLVAGLDEGRTFSDPSFHFSGTLTDNHAGDYAPGTLYGQIWRDALIHTAKSQEYSLVIDGSGIPWNKDINHGQAENFGKDGWFSCVGVTGMPLDIPGYEAYASALTNTDRRGRKQARYVPLDVVVTKSVQEAIAVMAACRDEAVKQVFILDTTVKDRHPPIIAATCDISEKDIDALREYRNHPDGPELLRGFLEKKGIVESPPYITFAPDTPENVPGFLIVRNHKNGTYRALVIFDMEMMVELQQKALVNSVDPEDPKKPVSRYSDLYFHNMPFDMDGIYQNENGHLVSLFNPGPNHRKADTAPYQLMLATTPLNLATTANKARFDLGSGANV